MKTKMGFGVAFLWVLAACSASPEESSGANTGAVGGEPTTPPPATSSPASPPPASTPTPPAPATPDLGAVFMISNDPAGNGVLAFERTESGALATAGVFATGGKGTGSGLGSQGALALSADGKLLVVVDAGSNELTAFSVEGTKLVWRSRVGSNGNQPVSVAIHGDLVYVLNAGDNSCISGFRIDAEGALTPIAGSKHSLSAPTTAAAQISFSPAGDAIVVTEKATNVIDTFVVLPDGSSSNGQALPSAGETPFGFAFTSTGHLVVSEAFGGAAGAGAMSSYSLSGTGAAERGLVTISPTVADRQAAPCWVVITSDNRFAYTSNTASGNISTYTVASSGALALVGDGANTSTGADSKPIDMALDRSTKHLYVLNAGSKNIMAFDVGGDGGLKPIGAAINLPGTPAGLVAR